jgi:gamma-glutamylcyclotransferase (GGCT)/AIG2-like uncharacterized protein YtfP
MENLFAYGTLKDKEVQERVFGRVLKGTNEKLIGYGIRKIQIEEEFGIIHYPIITETKNPEDSIDGISYPLSEIELELADKYEGMHYKRIKVQLESKETAWAYTTVE